MFKLIKNLLLLLFLAYLTYAACTYPLAGKTLLAHLVDIYETPQVQSKVKTIKQDLNQQVRKQFEQATQKAVSKAIAPKNSDDYSEQEKKVIEETIAKNLFSGAN